MTISIRLDKETESKLRQQLQQVDMSLSDFVRDAVREKMANYSTKISAYEAGKQLFGQHHSGRNDLSSNRKALLKEKIRAKHRH